MAETGKESENGLSSEDSRPKFAVDEILSESLVVKNDDNTSLSSPKELKGKYVGLYFSGHWCPPCRQFTPSLIQTYKAAKLAGHPLEVVFVSCDRNLGEFSDYYREMPWAAIPFGESVTRSKLMETFKVMSIPSLIILGPDGKVTNANARGDIAADPQAQHFPWFGSTDLTTGQRVRNLQRVFMLAMVLWILWYFFLRG